MSGTDKAKNKAEQISGTVREKVGAVKGDERMQAAGKKDQAKGHLKDAGEQVKDAGGKVKDAIKSSS